MSILEVCGEDGVLKLDTRESCRNGSCGGVSIFCRFVPRISPSASQGFRFMDESKHERAFSYAMFPGRVFRASPMETKKGGLSLKRTSCQNDRPVRTEVEDLIGRAFQEKVKTRHA